MNQVHLIIFNLVSILVYPIEVQDQIEVQGGIALYVYIVKLIKVQGGISFLFHENQRADGYFSWKLISVDIRLFARVIEIEKFVIKCFGQSLKIPATVYCCPSTMTNRVGICGIFSHLYVNFSEVLYLVP